MDLPQPFQILKMDRRRGNIVVSRRAILEETRAEQRIGLIQNLAEGQVIEGVVKNITDYGAFVDLGGIDGLLHVTDISYKRVNHPSEVINIGDTVKVQIIRINRETQRISLGMKQLESDPWEGASAKYPVGGVFRGRVTNITEYGAFVELEPGIEGLVHVSEMSWTKKNVHPGKIVSTSQEVDVKILEVDEEKRRISLGLKQAQENPWAAFASAHPVGSVVEGEVKNATEFGLFVGLEGEVDGMVHMSDIAWGVSGEEALALHRKGETVKAQVLDVDVEKERISLGMKQLEGGGAGAAAGTGAGASRGAAAAGGVKKGDVLTVTVRAVQDAGLDVQVGDDGATGFVKRTDLGPRPRRAASRALPGRPEVRRSGGRLRSFEEAQFLHQGDADRRGEAGRRAIWLVRLRRFARRYFGSSLEREGGGGRDEAQKEEVTRKAAFLCGTPPSLLPCVTQGFLTAWLSSGPRVWGSKGAGPQRSKTNRSGVADDPFRAGAKAVHRFSRAHAA